MSAVKFFGENHLHLENVIAARIGRGVRELPAAPGYSSCVVLVWRPGGNYNQFLELDRTDDEKVGKIRLAMIRDDWSQLRFIQLLLTDNTSALAEVGEGGRTAPDNASAHGGQLSTIPEGSHEDSTSEQMSSAGSYLQQNEEEFQAELDKFKDLMELPL